MIAHDTRVVTIIIAPAEAAELRPKLDLIGVQYRQPPPGSEVTGGLEVSIALPAVTLEMLAAKYGGESTPGFKARIYDDVVSGVRTVAAEAAAGVDVHDGAARQRARLS